VDSLVIAVGLVLVIEGLLWSLVPDFTRNLMRSAIDMDDNTLRIAGVVAIAVGVFIVWIARG
jgi:uncharacterized protein YjeT (DUF2065 family)